MLKNRSGSYAFQLLQKHFAGLPADEIVTSLRSFPARMRADLQIAVESLFNGGKPGARVVGLHQKYRHEALDLADLWQKGNQAVLVGPLQHIEVDVGAERPVRCLKNALWLLEDSGLPHAIVLSESMDHFAQSRDVQIEIAVPPGPEGEALTDGYFSALENAIAAAGCYRGKVLSLESDHSYSGKSSGIQVHRLRTVGRDEIILPNATLDLLERNVFDFFARREGLAELKMSVKKGLLFYGPPGTGKTHSIHYLAARLEGHTTLLITAEQMGLLKEYMALARLLQPSIVVIEDADLIARQREQMGGPCEESLLNQLLNEMDGLREDAEILFILTTNRPQTLEAALASRPGRIDQAIEFPLPNDDGRRKLARLYAKGLTVPDEVMDTVVKRTDQASAAFIKELMRRAAQFCLAREDGSSLDLTDVEAALDEILISGGRLNAKLLGIGVEAGAV